MRRRRAGGVAALALLAACSTSPVPVDPAPTPLGETAPSSGTIAEHDLPLALRGLPVLDPGWDQRPQELDGHLLGLVHPEADEPVRYVAARDDGELLWQAERPPSCTGFTLSRAGGRPVAVLMDVAPGDDTLTEVSASAYDLATGDPLWGPRPVPGPHQGPGTVFAAPAPGAVMGETGPRVALDPATGEEVADEADGDVVVGEYDGVVLTAGGGVLAAAGAASWEVALEDLGLASVVALPGVTPPAGTALLAEPGDWSGVLVDLTSGDVLAQGVVDAVREPVSGTLVTIEGERLVGYPEAGERWERPAEGARLVAAGNVFVYLRTGTAARAVNAVTGEPATAYDDRVAAPAVPVLVTARGAAVVEGDGLALVATEEW